MALPPMYTMPGGKMFQGKMIVQKFPAHTRYIEPFVGGGGIFFRKQKSKEEIINDKDAEIAFFFRYVQKHSTPPVIPHTFISRALFDKYKAMKPANEHQRAIRFLILQRISFRGNRTNYAPATAELVKMNKQTIFKNWRQYHDRLRGVVILNEDYRTVVRKYDTHGAFIYLDPPYETGTASDVTNASNAGDWYGKIKLEDLNQLVRSAKGKVMISFSDNPEMVKMSKQNKWRVQKYVTCKMPVRKQN